MKSISTLLLYFVLTSFSSSDLLPTSLKITIVDELGNVVKGADVTLYPTEKDYREETNPIASSVTDAKGRVTFKKLKPAVYFVHAIKEKRNNNAAGVQTDMLIAGKINKITIVIE